MSTKHHHVYTQGGSGEVREPLKQGKNDSWSKAGRNVLQQHYVDMLNGESAKLIKKRTLPNAGLPSEAAAGSSLHTGHLISPNSNLESIPRRPQYNTHKDVNAPTPKLHINQNVLNASNKNYNSPPRIQETQPTNATANSNDDLPQALIINSAQNLPA